jgi:hypothetical protein
MIGFAFASLSTVAFCRLGILFLILAQVSLPS